MPTRNSRLASASLTILFILALAVPHARGGESAEDIARLRQQRCAKPGEFVLLFSLGHASDVMPKDDARYDRLLAEVKAAGFNTVHSTYTPTRLELCRKHGLKMMLDFLAGDQRQHVYQSPNDCKTLCAKLQNDPAVWGYNIWNGSFGGSGAGRQRDILNVRRWDPTHPVFIGTLYDNGVEFLTIADVFGYYDLHWARKLQTHLEYPPKFAALARAAGSFYYSWQSSTAGKPGEENFRRCLWSANVAIACGQKGILWFLAPMKKETLAWTAEKDDIARVNRAIGPMAAELVKIGNPTEVYSTPRTQDTTGAALPPEQAGKVPGGFNPFAADGWIHPAAGEFILGHFADGQGEALYVASHRAFASQEVKLSFTRPVKVSRFDRATGKYRPLEIKAGGVSFTLEAGGGELLRVSREGVQPVPPKNVRIEGAFWSPKLKVLREDTIPHSWPYVAGSIEELKIAAGLPQKRTAPSGTWSEANLYKLLETTAYALAQHPDPALDRKVDEIIATVAAAQRADGYLHAHVMNQKRPAWGDLYHQHDGYVAGHLLEAAVAHFQATGKRNLLDIACKAADQAWEHFVKRQQPGFCGHAEFELALVELYRVTGEARYLELAREFIERRGKHPERATRYPPVYFQDDVPIRQQQAIAGHAVRAVFFATGVTDVALESGDRGLADAARRLWQSASQRKLYITGSAGASAAHEAFGADYDLPNNGYCESCAAGAMVDFAHRMLRLEGDAEAADELERALYNAVLHGIALDGKSSYYCNPLTDQNHPRDNNWCCCPPLLSRVLLGIGRYAYGVKGRNLFINLFLGGSCETSVAGTPVRLEMQTDYPWDGAVKIAVLPEQPADFALHVRVPGWCRRWTLKVNGEAIADPAIRKGYAVIARTWQKGDRVELDLAMPVMRMEAHPQVKADAGRVAIQRGPLVYALEGLDNSGDPEVSLAADPQFRTEHRPGLLGGVTVVQAASAAGKPLVAIPFFALANREKSWQRTWILQSGKKDQPRGWDGRLYREYEETRSTSDHAPFQTPEEVWAGFDPRREPLDVGLKAAWTEKGVGYKEFYFTGETVFGQPVRIYAEYAAPEGAKNLPAVLHIHGGGQTAYRSWLDFWVKRGYAAMSFNWGGHWPGREEHARWGQLVQGNHLDCDPGVVVSPNQHASCWYHWAVVSRRCLTYLEQQPEVDPKRLGIFGISMGGTLAWPIAAMDDRVKAACAIYGNGWDTFSPDRYAPDSRAAEPDTLLWRKTMEGQSYASRIKCPLLFMSATNDQHGRMDRVDDILAKVPAPTWQVHTVNHRHHIAPEQGRDLPLFMDAHLKGGPAWPKNPAVRLGLAADGVPQLTVTPDTAGQVERMEIYYALERTHPMGRHWRLAAATGGSDAWQARLPILDAKKHLFAFANVFYRSGVCLTSRLTSAIPAELGDAKATDRPSLMIDDFSEGTSDWVRSPAYVDPCEETTYIRPAVGPGGQKGVTQIEAGPWYVFCTRKIGDPKWRGPAGAALEFQVLSGKANRLRVSVMTKEIQPGAKTYVTYVDLTGSADWQSVSLPPGRFKTGGESLAAWDEITCLEIMSDTWQGSPPVLSRVRWAAAESPR